MKKILFSLLLAAICFTSNGQTKKEILEKATLIKTGKKLMLSFDETVLKYDIDDDFQVDDPSPLKDSAIFLLQKDDINIYMRPYNPLNYESTFENKILIDPVDEDISKAIASILDLIKTIDASNVVVGNQQKSLLELSTKLKNTKSKAITTQDCEDVKNILSSIEKITTLLNDNKKTEINSMFTALKAITFEDEESTKLSLKNVSDKKSAIVIYFTSIESEIKNALDQIEKYRCTDPQPFVAKYIFSNTLKELISLKNQQKKRLENLDKIYKIVEEMQTKASAGKDRIKWCIYLDNARVEEGKKTHFSVHIKKGGYKLSDDGEIITNDSKDLITRTITFKKFNRFIIEKSAGNAFTFFQYTEYGTETNANGDQVVSNAGQKNVNRLNFSAMLNFTYFLQNSSLRPFWQVGIGANTSIPSILTGIGIRFNFGETRFAFAGGVGFTWIKELDKLKVGDKISGTAELEKDLTYKFSWPPKPYVGIQYVF